MFSDLVNLKILFKLEPKLDRNRKAEILRSDYSRTGCWLLVWQLATLLMQLPTLLGVVGDTLITRRCERYFTYCVTPLYDYPPISTISYRICFAIFWFGPLFLDKEVTLSLHFTCSFPATVYS